jgi:hypothetical protein
MIRRITLCAMLLATAASAQAIFDPKPWLDDLAQMRAAMASKYANLEWAVFARGADLDDYFDRAAKRIASAQDAGSAKAAFEGLIRRLGDGHVQIDWPQPPTTGPQTKVTHDVCAETGFNSAKAAAPLVALAPGYVPLRAEHSDIFPSGTIALGKHRAGVLKIALFSSEAFPELCREALTTLSIAPDAPCPDDCADRIARWADARMTEYFIAQLEALKREKIDTLVVDITGNGGGGEWAEAAARMLSPKRLVSERIDFVRGAQWAKEFADSETALRDAAKTAAPQDRTFLLKLADQAQAKRAVAETQCDSAPLWKGQHPACAWLGEGFYASGMIASADPATLQGKPWAATMFTPMEYPYREGVWRGALIVLIDGESWSASEEFAALLQDNRAAFIVGEPTGGAGCGHTDGAAPTVLSHSGGQLSLPDCARVRADGSSETRGVVPDLALSWARHDGLKLRAVAFLKALPSAVELARMTMRHKS